MRHSLSLAAVAAALSLTACAAAVPGATASAPPPEPAPATTVGADSREVASLTPRLLYSHDGGLVLLDTATDETVHEEEHAGFLRLNDAGDGRHVVVSDGDVFRVHDTGIRARAHGDHSHYYESNPGLTGQVFDAPAAGHVVAHGGWTTLFADGTGDIVSMPSEVVADPGTLARTARTDAPHHGVALVLSDDSLLTTQGTTEARSTVQVIADDRVVAQTDDCPGVHGEATAQPTDGGDVVLLGCTNGPVVYRDGAFHKVAAPDEWARTGNTAGSPVSPVVLTDYKVDPDADLERPTRVALVDTRTDTLRLVDLGSSYWFRSLARGAHGEAIVLTYDGHVQVVDPDSGDVTARIAAIEPWAENDRWQEPGPSIKVLGHEAYVTDVATKRLVVVDLAEHRVARTFELAHTPTEIAVTAGSPAETFTHAAGDHDDD